MITALAPLGAKHRIQIVADYDGAGNVTATILLARKGKEDDEDHEPALTKPIQISGTIAEVEAYIADGLPAAATSIAGLQTNLEEVQAEAKSALEKAKAKKEEKTAAKATKKKPDKKEAPAKKDEPAKKQPATPAPATTEKPKLQPAWKSTPATAPAEPAPEAADLGSLFGE